MRIDLEREYESMEVAHRLTGGVPTNHKCRRPHGHSYKLKVIISGEVQPDGMVVEYGVIDATVKPIRALVDHHDLNTLSERCSTKYAAAISENPTVERLLIWFFFRLQLLASTRPEANIVLECIELEEDPRARVRMTKEQFEAGRAGERARPREAAKP